MSTPASANSRKATFFARHDVLLAPVCPTPAFPHNHRPRRESGFDEEPVARRATMIAPRRIGLKRMGVSVRAAVDASKVEEYSWR
jgi:Asp-tRNA(Asn)/Glu-tRNA(Gln) amidotransferase A subunit family amidase